MKTFWLKLVFTLLLLVSVLSTSCWAGANVFLYHRFGEPKYPSTNIGTDVFAAQLAYLQENNYRVLSLRDIVSRLRRGEALPEKCAALSVDDSFTSFLTGAMPLLRKYQYPVTLFVNGDAVGASGYLSWSQLRQLVLEGVEIGNHSMSHDHLVDLRPGETRATWGQRVRNDIEAAQELFERHLKMTPALFAYPYGEYSQELIEIVDDLGFEAAFAQQSGVIHETHQLMNLPRFPMGGPYATAKGFIDKLQMEPLVVIEESPLDPVVRDPQLPPRLRIRIAADGADLSRLNCFVQGDNSCTVTAVDGSDDTFEVVAEKPLTGRRNKYTLTAPGLTDQGWRWYSHLWIQSDAALER